MEKLTVDLKDRSYPIYIGEKLNAGELIREALPKVHTVLVVSNETIAPLYLKSLQESLEQQGFSVHACILKDGEKYKKVESYMQVLTAALEAGLSRDGAMLALGGGVVGDITGFAASTYQRGIAFVQVPTTLLAMVDSSVGGKTAINHDLGKNMIGTFYQPRCVVADIDTLRTLPEREVAAGLAEVIKYGIIYDRAFFEYLRERQESLLHPSPEVLTSIVRRCCEIKALVVSEDEQEHGLRAILNLGHTFGHAIEAECGFGTYLHGEAVAIGMVIASRYALTQGALSKDEVRAVEELLKACHLPVASPAGMDSDAYLKHMHHDKKVRDGHVVYVLPEKMGQCRTFKVSDEEMGEFLKKNICVG